MYMLNENEGKQKLLSNKHIKNIEIKKYRNKQI